MTSLNESFFHVNLSCVIPPDPLLVHNIDSISYDDNCLAQHTYCGIKYSYLIRISKHILLFQAIVDLEVMALKVCSALPWAQELQLHHQMKFSTIPLTPFLGEWGLPFLLDIQLVYSKSYWKCYNWDNYEILMRILHALLNISVKIIWELRQLEPLGSEVI